MERVDLGALPGRLLRLPPETRSLGHGARLPAVLDLAVLGVVDGLSKAALVRFLVDLGAARLLAAVNDIDHRLLAAHQLAHDRVDQAFLEQRAQALRRLHPRSDRSASVPSAASQAGCAQSC